MEILKYVGLVLFAVPFVLSGIGHLKETNALAGYAAFKNVPAPKVATIVSGVVLILAPLAVIFGVLPKIALVVLAAFLLITAFVFHNFWKAEGEAKMAEQINFNKNIGLAGAALAILALLP